MSHEEEQDDLRLPKNLTSELWWRYRSEIQLPPEVDRAILNCARAQMMRRSRLRDWRPLLRVGWAAAAAIILLALLTPAIYQHFHPRPQVAVETRAIGDVNGDGIVDVRDALALAKKVEARTASFTRFDDVNGDKVVDQKDVDAVAMLAVRVDRRGGAVQ